MIRLFVNIVDGAYADSDDEGGTDVVRLQSENDNLKFRVIEKDAAIKSKDEALERLRDENQKLSISQAQSRNIIIALEQKLESNKVLLATHNDQVCAMLCRPRQNNSFLQTSIGESATITAKRNRRFESEIKRSQ